jgi:hypothetical protein
MKAPFKKFKVKCNKFVSEFMVTVEPEAQLGDYNLELRQRKFIEDAIREKIDRSAASSTNEGAAPGGQ